jgi:hypothetical protein
MVLSLINYMCVGPVVNAEKQMSSHWTFKAAVILDTAIGFALVTIALLGRYHILPFSSSLSEYLLVAGGTYVGMITLHWIAKCKLKLCADKYLFNRPEPYVDSSSLENTTEIDQ